MDMYSSRAANDIGNIFSVKPVYVRTKYMRSACSLDAIREAILTQHESCVICVVIRRRRWCSITLKIPLLESVLLLVILLSIRVLRVRLSGRTEGRAHRVEERRRVLRLDDEVPARISRYHARHRVRVRSVRRRTTRCA